MPPRWPPNKKDPGQKYQQRQPGEGPPPDQLREQQQAGQIDNKRTRRPLQRKTIDYYSSTVRGLEMQMISGSGKLFPLTKPDPSYIVDVSIIMSS